MKISLTIAGSDSCGGAGIQADIKTMTANGVYAMSAITALTAQNTYGVAGIWEVTPEFLGMQLDCIFKDITPDSVKIGMVSSAPLTDIVVNKLIQYNAKNVVVDPVMISTSGFDLIKGSALEIMKNRLFPLADLITPNIPEAETLCGISITSAEDMESAAKMMWNTWSVPILIKGGHGTNDANDLLYDGSGFFWINAIKIENPNTHGTGCTFSSAIASNLAKGYTLRHSVITAKEYVTGAISDMLDLGRGSGPLNHTFDINSKYAKSCEN